MPMPFLGQPMALLRQPRCDEALRAAQETLIHPRLAHPLALPPASAATPEGSERGRESSRDEEHEEDLRGWNQPTFP